MNTKRITLGLAALTLRTGRFAIVPASLLFLVAFLSVAFAARPAQAQLVLLVTNFGNNTVGEYDATTGATINAAFINGQGLTGPRGLALDDSNHLFICNNNATVGQYNASTGATVNATFINGQGLTDPSELALDGNNHLFVANYNNFTVGQYNASTGAVVNATFIGGQDPIRAPSALALDGNNHLFVVEYNRVGEFDATTGATINAAFIDYGLDTPYGIALDGNNHLFVSNFGNNGGTVGEYDATTGATLNADFINGQGTNGRVGLGLDGHNHLFVANFGNSTGEYDATTGATINEHFITGLQDITGLAFVSPVPEPSTYVLAGLAAAGFAAIARRRQRRQKCLSVKTGFITLILAALLPVRTGPVAIVPASLLCFVALLAAVLAARPAQAQPVLLVANNTSATGSVGNYDAATGAAINVPFFSSPYLHNMVVDQYNHLFVAGATVSEYNAITGATINANFITDGLYGPQRLALDGNNHLFVSNDGVSNIVGKYDATTGTTINSNFIQGNDPPGLNNIHGLAVDNKNHLFVSNSNANTVGEYDATTGATINATFIHQGLHDPEVLLLDGLGHLLVGDNYDTATVGMYDATTGATINAAFVPGEAGGTYALALDGSNHLFVANIFNGVGEYDATTGATINDNFITGRNIFGLAFVAGVPEPSTFVLAGIGFLSLLTYIQQQRRF